MKRREFITLLGGAAAWPLAVRAQPTGIPRIGIIGDEDAPIWDHFRQGLRDNGYVVGQNVALEYRAAQSNVDLMRRAALELAALPVGQSSRSWLATWDRMTMRKRPSRRCGNGERSLSTRWTKAKAVACVKPMESITPDW
jgi:hypothetical protein